MDCVCVPVLYVAQTCWWAFSPGGVCVCVCVCVPVCVCFCVYVCVNTAIVSALCMSIVSSAELDQAAVSGGD